MMPFFWDSTCSCFGKLLLALFSLMASRVAFSSGLFPFYCDWCSPHLSPSLDQAICSVYISCSRNVACWLRDSKLLVLTHLWGKGWVHKTPSAPSRAREALHHLLFPNRNEPTTQNVKTALVVSRPSNYKRALPNCFRTLPSRQTHPVASFVGTHRAWLLTESLGW